MAFWGIGKLKNLTEKISMKDMGSKLKTYVHSSHEEQSTSQEEPRISENELLRVQYQEYQKLLDLEAQILAEVNAEEEKKYEQREQELMKKLKEVKEEAEREAREEQVWEMAEEIESGKKGLREVMMENILMKEQMMQKAEGTINIL